MTSAESAITFECEGLHLQGVLCQPSCAAPVGIVVLVGGPQYRAGSHRQFVTLARGLAQWGAASLRFDVRGMGDSEGQPLGFEHQTSDVAAAIAALLKAVPSVDKVVLFGLCDGASAALLYQWHTSDARIAGLVLLNPWVRSEATLARTQVKHYYAQRLRDPNFWRKLFSGRVADSAVSEAMHAVKKVIRSMVSSRVAGADTALTYQERMAQAWLREASPLLLLLSGNDYTAREFDEAVQSQAAWLGAYERPGFSRCDLVGADHTLSTPESAQAALQAVCAWLHQQALNTPSMVEPHYARRQSRRSLFE